MKITMVGMIWSVVFGMATLVGTGWAAKEYVEWRLSEKASTDQVMVAGGKADFVLDRQMEAIIREIAEIERKPNPTRGEIARLNHLRTIYYEMQRVRTGK